ncbi:MAG: Ig-like domain-containing protein, partial [Parcubacteria group bacterium]|nr:Ig-like domain-containing protein [Parcubacteria group bacterium]
MFWRRPERFQGLAFTTIVSLLLSSFGVFVPIASAAITTNTAANVVTFNQKTKVSSNAFAMLGLDMVASGGETLSSVTFALDGTAGFTTADLALMGTATSSGLALYKDNKSGGMAGSFDAADLNVALSAAPVPLQVAQFSKLTASSSALVTDSSMALNSGDIVFTKVSANPSGFKYDWHLVTTGGTGVNAAGLRLDGAGSAPTYAASSRFSQFAPQSTTTGDGSVTAGGKLTVSAGDLVFGRRATEAAYSWHIVTAGATLSDDTAENDAALNGQADDPAMFASTTFSKIAPAGTATDNGATAGGVLTVALGDMVFVKIGTAYGWHIVTAAGNLSSDATENTAFLDGASTDPGIAASSQMSKISTAGGSWQAATAATSDSALALTAGDAAFAQITNNPGGISPSWSMITTGATGVSGAALRANDFTAAPTYGWIATLTPAAGAAIPADETGSNAGNDYFIAARTSASAVNAHAFTLGVAPGSAAFSANTPVGSPVAVTSSSVTVDTAAPTVDTSRTGPANGSTGVPISAFIHMSFNENLDQSTLNPANVTLTTGGTPVPASVRPFPDGFDVVVSGPPTYAASTRFAKASTLSTGFFMIMTPGSTIFPQGGYTAPSAGDIIIFQHDTFPPEVGVITNPTLTAGTFAVNDFSLFGGQQITKFAAPAATGLVSASTVLNAGDIIVANTSANPSGFKYDWHVVTTPAAVNNSALRLDGASAAPTYATTSGRFSTITPAATTTDNGATAGGVLAVSVGDMVFAKLATGVGYAWHLATGAGNVSSDTTEATAVLDSLAGAAASKVAAGSVIAKITPAAEGAISDTTTALSFGDIVLAHTTANASNNGAYAFHMVNGTATGANSANLRFDNASSNLSPSTTYVVTATTGVTDSAGNPLSSNQTLSFTTGSAGATNNTPPFVQSSLPQPGNQQFSPNAPLKLTFSVDMITSGGGSITDSANTGLFLDNFGAPGSTVAATLTYDSSTKTLTVTPSSTLTVNTGYILKVGTGATSATGAPLGMEYRLYFKTASASDSTAPTVLGVSPASGTTGVSRSAVVTAGFSEDMNPTTISATTVTLKRTSDSAAVTGNSSYNPSSRSASFAPSVLLDANTGYTFTVVSGGSGVKDLAANALAANYTSTFTTTAAADTDLPKVSFGNADNFGLAITFSELVKTGGGANAADNIANYTLESPVGSSISLGGKTVTFDSGTKTARISGLALQNGTGYKVTVAATVQDLAGNAMDTTGTPASNTAFGTVANSSTTGGSLGPGSGTTNFSEQGMNPTRVSPQVRAAGAISGYKAEFPVATSIPLGGQIVLTLPSGFGVANAVAATAGTESFCNSDLNGPAAGTVTIASIAKDAGAGSITITTGGAATGANTFLCFDLKNITNSTVPNTAGYTVDIKTRDTAANNLAILETKTSAPFFLGAVGSRTLTVNVFNDTNSNGAKNGGEELANARVFLFSPATGGQSTTTSAAGVATFLTLADGDYMIGIDPSSISSISFNSAPQPINIAADTTKNFALHAAPYTIAGTVTGTSGTKVDVFGASQNGFAKTTLTLTGAADAYSLGVQASTTYMVGVGPAMPTGSMEPGAPPPPMPTFTFMPPPNIEVAVTNANVTGKNFTLSTAGKTITGTVVDSSGTGVSNAGIFARPVSDSTTGGTSVGFGTGSQTDTQGNFTLNVVPGVYLVGVFKPGMPNVKDKQITVPTSGANSPASLSFTLDAATTITISGTVKDDAGNPIPYAGVGGRKVVSTADTTPLGGDSANFVGGPTDANGSYTLYVNAGTWVVEAFAPGFGKLGTKTVTVTTSSLSGQDFSAQTLSMGTITGQALKATVAQQGVMVRAEGANGGNMGVTDASGNYSLRVPAGSYTVRCFFPGVGEATPLTSVSVTANTTTSGQDCSLAAPITVTVRVTDGTNAITDAFVDVRDASGRGNGTNVSTTNGVNAVYTVAVPPGTYTVRVGHPAFGMIGSTSGVNSTQTITYTVGGSLNAVSGTVQLSGSALSGAWVSIIGTPTGQTNVINIGGQTNSSGAFSVSVPAGSYRIRADKPGYKSSAETSLTVSGATSAGTLTVTEATRSISGTVTLSGNPISGAVVDATNGSGGFAVAQTNSSGAYGLAVDSGSWTVRAHSMGYEGGPETANTTSGNVSGKTIALSAISGFVVKPEKQETITPSSGGLLTHTDIGASFKL